MTDLPTRAATAEIDLPTRAATAERDGLLVGVFDALYAKAKEKGFEFPKPELLITKGLFAASKSSAWNIGNRIYLDSDRLSEALKSKDPNAIHRLFFILAHEMGHVAFRHFFPDNINNTEAARQNPLIAGRTPQIAREELTVDAFAGLLLESQEGIKGFIERNKGRPLPSGYPALQFRGDAVAIGSQGKAVGVVYSDDGTCTIKELKPIDHIKGSVPLRVVSGPEQCR